ncbi:MAG: DUF2336 domain-containing protein [Rhodospirillales bacterium]|nr:DUF2336 domain-containing protein [Rhodospirillales bacterium]
MSEEILKAEKVTYEEAKELARHADPEVRRSLAKRRDLQSEILYYLAEDADAEVRQSVAQNTTAPRQTDILLAKDDDAAVRGDLASKIARVAPGLSADEQDKARKATYEALELLAQDQITKVREILSDALKDVTNAPPDVIKTLALDTEITVSGPVLEFSPVLTDDVLLEIIESGTAKGGLNAISKRSGVAETVSDAIVATDDVNAIADLLTNESAHIREATLDDLIERAPDVALWHTPLVSRPKLPDGAGTRLAQFLADNLLEVLKERSDLDAESLEAVKAVVKQRIGSEDGGHEADAGQDFLNMEPPLDMVERLFRARKLDGKVVGKALNAGDHSFVLAALAVRTGLNPQIVKRVFQEKSARGIMAMAWKASMPAKMAVQMQQRMGRLAPSEVVMPENDDDYPLSEDDMNWQVEFFTDLCAKGAG